MAQQSTGMLKGFFIGMIVALFITGGLWGTLYYVANEKVTELLARLRGAKDELKNDEDDPFKVNTDPSKVPPPPGSRRPQPGIPGGPGGPRPGIPGIPPIPPMPGNGGPTSINIEGVGSVPRTEDGLQWMPLPRSNLETTGYTPVRLKQPIMKEFPNGIASHAILDYGESIAVITTDGKLSYFKLDGSKEYFMNLQVPEGAGELSGHILPIVCHPDHGKLTQYTTSGTPGITKTIQQLPIHLAGSYQQNYQWLSTKKHQRVLLDSSTLRTYYLGRLAHDVLDSKDYYPTTWTSPSKNIALLAQFDRADKIAVVNLQQRQILLKKLEKDIQLPNVNVRIRLSGRGDNAFLDSGHVLPLITKELPTQEVWSDKIDPNLVRIPAFDSEHVLEYELGNGVKPDQLRILTYYNVRHILATIERDTRFSDGYQVFSNTHFSFNKGYIAFVTDKNVKVIPLPSSISGPLKESELCKALAPKVDPKPKDPMPMNPMPKVDPKVPSGDVIDFVSPAPAVAPDMEPTKLTERTEIELPATFDDYCYGGHGRYVVVRYTVLPQLAIYDLTTRERVAVIPLPNAKTPFAASADSVVIFSDTVSSFSSYDLATGKRKKLAPTPFNRVEQMQMGFASNGPLWVRGDRGTHLVDLESLKIMKSPSATIPTVFPRSDVWISGNGQVFGSKQLRVGGKLSASSISIAGKDWKEASEDSVTDYVIPSATGKQLFVSGHGVFSDQLRTLPGSSFSLGKLAGEPSLKLLPASSDDFYLHLHLDGGKKYYAEQPENGVTVYSSKTFKPVATIEAPAGDLSAPGSNVSAFLSVPHQLLTLIPEKKDRIVLIPVPQVGGK
ncbi:MAG: hypothetical protein R3B84_23595 [Zavarzinella sp.]